MRNGRRDRPEKKKDQGFSTPGKDRQAKKPVNKLKNQKKRGERKKNRPHEKKKKGRKSSKKRNH